MFYNEKGKHVRTKKEILDEGGNLRPGCKIIKKGEVYETNFFHPKKEEFKSNAFLENMKQVMTDAINEIVKDEVKPENNETTIEDNNGTEENNNIVNNIIKLIITIISTC